MGGFCCVVGGWWLVVGDLILPVDDGDGDGKDMIMLTKRLRRMRRMRMMRVMRMMRMIRTWFRSHTSPCI